MKKSLLYSFIVLCSLLLSTQNSEAQCTNNTTAYWTHTASNTLNVTDALASCHYLTEYSTINGMNVGGLYEFTMTSGGGTGNAYITVMTGPAGTGTVVAHGVSPLTVVATAATLYPHWNIDATCATSTFCEVGTMTYLATPAACIQPIALGASAITTTSALANWTDPNTTPAPDYDVYVDLAFAPAPINTTPPTATSITNTVTLGSLTPGTQYDYYVRGRCSALDTSAWSGPYTFTTLATCVAPSNLTATNVTSSGVDMGWTENNSATQWDIELGLAGFSPTGAPTPGFGNTMTNPYVLPAGLPPNTCFDFYVRSQCGPGDTSTWTGPFTFCTLVGGLACPPGAGPGVIFYEGFNGATATTTELTITLPTWSQNGGTAGATGMHWRTDNNAGNSGGTGPSAGHSANSNPGYAFLETSSGPGFDTMFSAPVDLTSAAGAARVKFFYHAYGAQVDQMHFLVRHATGVDSLWGVTSFTQTGATDPWDSVVIPLNAYVGQTIELAWLGMNAAGCCSGDIAVDEVEVEACISCPAPTNIVASNVMGTSCDLSWTENGSATLWDIEIVPAGNAPTGIPDSVGVTTNVNKMITGLTQFQAVDFYVRASCSASDSSLWTGPYTVLPCAALAGNYTVDPGAPASATNFQSLNAVAVGLQCGISAPVVFDMAPTNTFNEQVEFPEVPGASATNTVTFNGNGDSVVFATTGANWAVIRLDGADFFRFNDIVIVSTSTANAIPLHMYLGSNSADNNMFTGCTFAVPISSTNFGACPFGVSGSLTSPNSTPINRADNNIIDSCTFIGGGSYGMAMWGQGTPPFSSGNQVLNSDFVDFNQFGLYHAQQDNFSLSNCTFSQPNRTTFAATYPVYGDVSGDNNVYKRNRIHNIPAANTQTFYGFFFFMDASSVANSNTIKNNLIEDVNNTGQQVGIYVTNANNMKMYHNTIVFDHTASSSAAISRGIWQEGPAPGQDIQNNNIFITRGGTGTNHGIWLDAPAPTCDFNNCFVNGAGTNFFGENSGNQADLVAWQASTPTVGANSFGVDPIFTQPAPDYSPANASLNNTASTGLSVTADFTGAPRSVTPDIGAFEFTVAPTDMGVTAILSPDTNIGCYTATETVQVELTNYGSTVHDFSANPTAVTVQVTTPGGPLTLNATVNTGTLAVLGTLSVTMAPTVDMTANGAYTMNAYSSTLSDANLSNDTLGTTYNYNVNLVAGTMSLSTEEICASGTTVATLMGNAGGFIQWQTSPNGMAPWSNVGAGMNPHTSAVLTSTIYYRAMLTCNGAMDSTNIDTVVVNNPGVTSTTTDTVCGTDTVNLTATTTFPNLFWYANQTGGSLLDTGTNFSAVISATDTFWVSAATGATGNPVLITEVCQFTTSAYVNPGAPYPTTLDDPIELTNIGTSPVDISGWKVEVTGAIPGNIVIPAGNVLPPGGTFVIDRGFTATPDIPNVYHYAGSALNTSSGNASGYILSNASGVIQDVTATNSFNPVTTGSPAATAADWTGTTGNSGSTGGIRRTAVDDTNDGSDWTIATGANTTNYGTINVAFTPTGCEGLRVPVIAVSNPATPIMASADSTVCWDGSISLPLTVSSTNATYTYSWSPALGLDVTTGDSVNANPLIPTQYVVTGVDPTGCGNTDTINIAVQEEHFAMATSDKSYICGTDSVMLDVTDSIPPAPYCASGATNGFDTKIDTMSFAGVTFGTSPTAQETYTDNTGTPIPAAAGGPLPLAIVNGSSTFNYYGGTVTVWIDYNQNGVYEASEQVYQFITTGLNTIPPTTVTIPTTALNGPTGMRVILPEAGTTAACGTWTYGETEDYTVVISGGVTPMGNTYTYSWMPGSLMGAMQTVTPAVTTTYNALQTDQFGCVAIDSVTIAAGPVSGILAQATAANASSTPGSANQSVSQPDGSSLSYFDASCNLISLVDDGAGGNVLGMVTSTVNVDATVPTHNGEPFTARWYQITPTSNGPADVTLYFTQADFDTYNAHPAVVAGTHDSLPTGPADAAGIARLRITKNDDGGLGVNPVELTPSSPPFWNAVDSRWEVTVAVPSFSQFRAHAANPLNTPLPVRLTKFTVTKEGSVSLAAWITESEQNNSHFNLQRSLDGNSFTTLGKVNTKAVNGTSTTELSYDFTDVAPQIGHNYYRLEQVDQVGNLSYSEIIDVVWGADGSIVTIYPNPATDILNIDLSTDRVSQAEVKLLDMSGRVVKSVVAKTAKGLNHITLELDEVAVGVYGIQIFENNKLMHVGKVRKN